MHSIAGPYTHRLKCSRRVSHALWPGIFQVKSFSFKGLAICQGHTHTHTHRSSHRNTQMCTYKQPDTHKLEMMAICSATFHWDMCAHSNQESRHSGTLRLRQLLVSTGKMCAGEFSAVLFMMQMSQLRVFTFSFNHGWIGPRKTRLDRDFLVLDSEHWLQPNSFYTHFSSDPHADLNSRGSHL